MGFPSRSLQRSTKNQFFGPNYTIKHYKFGYCLSLINCIVTLDEFSLSETQFLHLYDVFTARIQ